MGRGGASADVPPPRLSAQVIDRVFPAKRAGTSVVDRPRLVDLQDLSDEHGGLNVVECSKELGFIIKRVYYFHGVPEDQERGFHAHKAFEDED